MDRILYNGTFMTLEKEAPYVEAVAIKDGKISAMGSKEEILALKEEATEVVDLGGAFVVPGLIDSHMHLADTAYLRTKLDLGSCRSLQEVKDKIAEEAKRIKASGKKEWISGVNFNQNSWKDTNELPTRFDLDEVSGDVPCYIIRVCGHVAVHNTICMEEMGLLSERPGTERKMSFFPDETPTGQMFESDADPAEEFVAKPSLEDYKAWIRQETERYAALGLAAIHSDDLNLVDPGKDSAMVMQAYREVAEEGGMKIHVYEQCRIEKPELVKAFAEEYPYGTTYGAFGEFKTVSFKEMMDGSLGAHSAFMRNGYLNDPEAASIAIHSDQEIHDLVYEANTHGYPVVAHCIGDAAVDQLLNAFDAVKEETGTSQRNGIVHCQIMGFDQLERMQKEDILAYVQPVFVGTDALIVEGCVGKEITEQSYNWRKMQDMGIHISGGSDCPVEINDPINNLYYAVTRDGGNGKSWYGHNALTMEEAIRAFTIEGAYGAGEEERRGSIKVGKYADLTVIDRNLMEMDIWKVREAKVLMTIVDGKIVYQV